MPGMRFMSIGAEGPPIAASSDGQFQLFKKSKVSAPGGPDSNVNALAEDWILTCTIDKDSFLMGHYAEEQGRKLLTYASAYPERARHAARKLHYEGDPEPLEALLSQALSFEPKLPRNVKVTIEVQVVMRGTDADIVDYLTGKLGYAVAVKKVHSIKVGD